MNPRAPGAGDVAVARPHQVATDRPLSGTGAQAQASAAPDSRCRYRPAARRRSVVLGRFLPVAPQGDARAYQSGPSCHGSGPVAVPRGSADPWRRIPRQPPVASCERRGRCGLAVARYSRPFTAKATLQSAVRTLSARPRRLPALIDRHPRAPLRGSGPSSIAGREPRCSPGCDQEHSDWRMPSLHLASTACPRSTSRCRARMSR
jgi:hypothetical protein